MQLQLLMLLRVLCRGVIRKQGSYLVGSGLLYFLFSATGFITLQQGIKHGSCGSVYLFSALHFISVFRITYLTWGCYLQGEKRFLTRVFMEQQLQFIKEIHNVILAPEIHSVKYLLLLCDVKNERRHEKIFFEFFFFFGKINYENLWNFCIY